jgi:hypothetical protein
LCYLPAWLYRVTLKSTAWFWWPLAFLGGELQRAKHPEIFHWNVMGSLWAKANIAIAVAGILSFLLANLILTGAILKENPLLTPLGYFLVVDWAVRPWQLLAVGIAVLSLLIVFLVDSVSGKYSIAAKNNDEATFAIAERDFGRIERLVRFRFILTIILWSLAGAQAVLYFDNSKCWFRIPPNVVAWGEWAYGEKMPQARCP